MKAKEYAEKYGNLLINATSSEEWCAVVADLFGDMCLEMTEICRKRHICRRPAYLALIKEFNQKGNAINRLLPKPVFKEDWFAIQYSKEAAAMVEEKGEDPDRFCFTIDELKGARKNV